MRATDLRQNDGFMGSTNAYVKVVLASKLYDLANRFSGTKSVTRETNSMPSTTSPEWRARLKYSVDDRQFDRLIFYVFDKSPSGRDLLLGKAHFLLSTLKTDQHGRASKQVKLHVRSPGTNEQSLLLCAGEPQGALHVMISAAWAGADAHGAGGAITQRFSDLKHAFRNRSKHRLSRGARSPKSGGGKGEDKMGKKKKKKSKSSRGHRLGGRRTTQKSIDEEVAAEGGVSPIPEGPSL